MSLIVSLKGLALYVRRIDAKKHGSPPEFARRCADGGLKWVAIGGPWHDRDSSGLMNDPAVIHRYADALAKRGLTVFVWGYPWQGREKLFAQQMSRCAGDHRNALLDPELGSNPSKAKGGAGKARANEHASALVSLIAEERFEMCGLSTFGSGWRLGWFPMLAFTRALLAYFRGATFIGGQTYTDNNVIDMSIADMLEVIRCADGTARIANIAAADIADIAVVPNFGNYKFVPKDPTQKLSTKNRQAKPKSPDELRVHLYEFVNEDEPVDAMIGWAENFATQKQWEVLREFSALLERGAGRLRRL